jgi:hypothetical protein
MCIRDRPGAESAKPSTSNIGDLSLMRTKGSVTKPTSFTVGVATNIPLGTSTIIPKAGLLRTVGDYNGTAPGFITAKSGMLTQMPIAQQDITITKEGGEKYVIKAGDGIDNEQLEALKKTGTNPSAVKYQPVAVYEYEVNQPDPNNPNKTIAAKKYAIRKIQPGAMNEMFSPQDVNKGVANQYYQLHSGEADRLTGEYKASIQQRLEQEKQAKAAQQTAPAAPAAAPAIKTPAVPPAKGTTVPPATKPAQPQKTPAAPKPVTPKNTPSNKVDSVPSNKIIKGNSTFQVKPGTIKKKK